MTPTTLEMPTLPASPARLDEQSLRRPGFLGGKPVTLADGQVWYVPTPSIVLVRDRSASDGARFDFAFAGEVDPVFGKLRRDFEDQQETEGDRRIATEMALLDYSLCRNYDLSDEAISSLIRFEVGPDAEDPIRAAIHAALSGVAAPKPSTGGSDLL